MIARDRNGIRTEYIYDYNRPTDIFYPVNPANNVHYEYGAPNAPNNGAGRIIYQEDGSGWQKFSYDALGNISENIRTFVLPYEDQTYTFKMNFDYDSWNRIRQMTYPDGEEVSYFYNLGGNLQNIEGIKSGIPYTYIKNITYNEFEKKRLVEYGNGSSIGYYYDVLLRLNTLVSNTGFGETMHQIDYQYDNVNNITSIDNTAGALNNGLGGSYKQNYHYDNLYRLIKSNGQWYGSSLNTYDLNMDYFADGRIMKKTQSADLLTNGNYIQINYANDYLYSNAHQVDRVIDGNNIQHMDWDINGNLIFHQSHAPFKDRYLCWDEENRLQGVDDHLFTSLYFYDAGGERTYKLTGQKQDMNMNGYWYHGAILDNPTLYTSPYLVANQKSYTKHYYADSERFASKIGMGGLQNLIEPCLNEGGMRGEQPPPPPSIDTCEKIRDKIDKKKFEIEQMCARIFDCLKTAPLIEQNLLSPLQSYQEELCPESELYFYHPDHLGSSSWITDVNGAAIQHLMYLPFGENWIDQRVTGWNAPYTFSGKERDFETSYS